MSATVRWMSVLIDVPAAHEAASSAFWGAVTATAPGDPIGEHGEFHGFEPDGADTCLWLQRTGSGPPACHPDVYTDDVTVLAARLTAGGGSVLTEEAWWLRCASPGGLPFCVVAHRGQSRRAGPVGEPGSRSAVDQLCLDIPRERFDVEYRFWQDLLDWQPGPAQQHEEFERLVRPPWMPYGLLLQRLDDEQPAVTAHLDLASEDRDAEADRHLALGATLVRWMPGWTVLQDPVGMTYCVTTRRPGAV